MHEAFADWYAKADREPTAERLQYRSEGVDAFNRGTNLKNLLDLLRFLKQPEHKSSALELLRNTLKTKDEAFLLRDNDVELRVLATISMMLAIENNSQVSAATALAVQAASLQGTRELGPLSNDLIETALRYLTAQSRQLRPEPELLGHREWKVAIPKLKTFAFPSDDEEADQREQNLQALAKHVGTLQTALNGLSGRFAEIAKTQQALVKASHFNTVLGEECSMLWWIFGAHSRDLEKPFTSLPPDSLSLFFGKDLADLTRIIPGAQSIPALMHKAFTQADVDAAEEIELKTIVDHAPWEWRSRWIKETDVGDLRGIAQCLPAVAASIEVGKEGNWQEIVKRRDGVHPEARLTKLDWARLCHCECLLLRECEDASDDE